MAAPAGIDVSNHQGTVDWAAVAGVSPPIRFAWCKVSEGRTFADAFWARNHREAKRRGIAVGGYHFARPQNRAADEADWFLSKLGAEAGDLAPVLDLEDDDGQPSSKVRSFALAWLRAVERELGVTPFLYTYPAFAAEHALGETPALAQYPLWIAHYQVSQPTIPRPWRKAVAWQWTSEGRVAGVSGRCDRNHWLGVPDLFCGHRL